MRWLAVACILAGADGVAATTPAPTPLPSGPLSIARRAEETPWADRKLAMRRNEARMLSKRELNEDLMLLSRVVDLFFVPRTTEERTGVQVRDRTVATLHQLAPYSVSSTHGAILSMGDRIAVCARPPEEKWPCEPDFSTRPPVDPALQPYEVTLSPSKIGRLVIRDLSNAAHPAWAKLDLTPLSSARGLVIDLRAAWGADPRPLLPWLRSITGRATLAPLREIRRPSQLTPYVDTYRRRYLAEGRDPAVWAPLVGVPSAGHATNIPIVVLVGRHCESACELVTRVLETWADATVVGSVMRSGRLHRDEPAVVTLPHSRIDLYFHATEYLLSTEIEEKTGPTSGWWLARRDEGVDYDGTAIAVRELERRIATRRWPAPCSTFRAWGSAAELPPAVRKKIPNAFEFDDRSCDRGRLTASVKADVTLHTMRRLIASCQHPAPIGWHSEGNFHFGVVIGVELASQLAQSEVVERIDVRCADPVEPN